MKKSFKKLRDALFAVEITQDELARRMGVCTAHVNRMFNGHTQWQLNQMYIALDAVGGKSLDEYFPKDGIA